MGYYRREISEDSRIIDSESQESSEDSGNSRY
jgi:hypothetical protein